MGNWKQILDISDLVGEDMDVDDVLPAATLLAVKARVLAIDPDVEFREASLKYYDAEHLETEKERINFMEDLYDWADAQSVWVKSTKA